MKLLDAVSMMEDMFMHFCAAEKKPQIFVLCFYLLLEQY